MPPCGLARDDAAVGLDNAETEGGGRQDDTNSILSSKSACWIASYMQHLYPNYVCHFNNYNKTVYRFPFVCEFIWYLSVLEIIQGLNFATIYACTIVHTGKHKFLDPPATYNHTHVASKPVSCARGATEQSDSSRAQSLGAKRVLSKLEPKEHRERSRSRVRPSSRNMICGLNCSQNSSDQLNCSQTDQIS
jgi:hypothetical protein